MFIGLLVVDCGIIKLDIMKTAIKEKLNVMPGADELIKGHEESLTGYSCPKCDKSLSDTGQESIKNQSKQIFTGDYSEWDHEPGLSWVETHECTNCKTKFWLMNGC